MTLFRNGKIIYKAHYGWLRPINVTKDLLRKCEGQHEYFVKDGLFYLRLRNFFPVTHYKISWIIKIIYLLAQFDKICDNFPPNIYKPVASGHWSMLPDVFFQNPPNFLKWIEKVATFWLIFKIAYFWTKYTNCIYKYTYLW